MRAKLTDLDVYPEIAEFNREFIRLMLDPDAPDTKDLFGMPQQSLQALRHPDFRFMAALMRFHACWSNWRLCYLRAQIPR